MNNFSRRPGKGQGGSRPTSGKPRFNKFKRRETPEDRLMKALGGDAGNVPSGSSAMPKVSRRPQPSRQRGVRKPARGQYIHPSKFVNKSVREKEQVVYEAQHVFADFPLNHRLQANIDAKGYIAPSAIQDQSIPAILEGRDVIGLANTGTGKTAAFLIPSIQKLMDTPAPLSVLIITPTRELATQIDDEFRAFAKDLRLYSSVCVGGMNIGRQIHSLKRRPHVVIGTPGRLKDLINQKALNLQNVHTLVLDEADRMCDMGFLPDIKSIISYVPAERQNLFFSATMTITIAALITEMMRDPITVSVVRGETSDHVYQDVVEARDKNHKVDLLTDMQIGRAHV